MKNRLTTLIAALFLITSHSAYTSDNLSGAGIRLSSKKVLSPQIEVLATLFNLPLKPVVKYSEGEFKKYVILAIKKRVFTNIFQVKKYNGR